MSPGPVPGNVIDLSQAVRDGARVPANKVLGVLRVSAQKRIGPLANALFERVDDALFDMAERAASNSNQAHFFDGMREIRKKRHAAETHFIEGIAKVFADFEAGKLAPTADELASGNARREREPLSLMEESELEESLALAAMVDKAETRLNRPLFALSQRFGVLAGSRTVDHSNNPLGPRMLSQSFVAGMRDFDVDLQVKLIVLKLFERHVLAELESIYEEANNLLVATGVLPHLKYVVPPRQAGDPAPANPAKASPAAAEVPAPSTAEHEVESRPDSEMAQLVSELHTLLSARRPRTAPVSSALAGHPTPGTRTHGSHPGQQSARELLNALSLMQTELHSQPLPARGSSGHASGSAPAQVKQELLDQMRRLGGGQRSAQLGQDEDTIDLVGMLFDYAVQDRNLPAPIQALLGRLQIPYLKVALMDRDFVSRKTHPARRLLDDVAQACVGWSEESDKDQRLYNKVQDVVGTLLREFDDDTGVFERLNTDFNDFVDKNRKRAELAERRTAESARGREKLETAQRTAARSILSKVSGRGIPSNVRELLTRRWSNYLVLTHLRHGEESHEWREAQQFVDDFTWSVEPKTQEADRLKLRDMMPQLESMLRQGLTATGFHEGHLDELWSEVEEIYEQNIMGDTPVAPEPAVQAAHAEAQAAADSGLTIRFASSKAGEEVVFSPAEANGYDEAAANAMVDALGAWIKIARALKTGTWFEFIRDDGSRERAKLLWISTIRALYLFVNRNGLKIAEKTAQELAEELKDQKAVILEQVALVDRALQAILEQLRSSNASGDAAAANAAAPAGVVAPDGQAPPPANDGTAAPTQPAAAAAAPAAPAPRLPLNFHFQAPTRITPEFEPKK